MSLGDFKKLLGLQGMELLDFSAQLVSKPQPSTLAEPLISPEPVLLDGAIDEWQKAADGMTFRLSEFEQQVTLVLQAWQAPPEFLTYTSAVADVMEAQQTAMQQVKKLLDDVKKGSDDDKKATLDDLKELAEGRQLAKIKSPSMPDLSNVKSFRLITS